VVVIFNALLYNFKKNHPKIKIILMLISIVFVKAMYDVTYLKLTLYHVLVLMFLFLLIGILSAEKKSSIHTS
jgi:hypothetical protein